MLAGGETTAPDLLELYLERIDRLDSQINVYRTVRLVGARAEALDAQVGGLVSDGRTAALRAGEAALAARVNRIFDTVEVVLTPGTATAAASRGMPAARRVRHVQRAPGPLAVSGDLQRDGPAGRVPWGLAAGGLPVSVQLVGRPNDEATLLALSTQIEQTRPWAGRRPLAF